MIAGILPNLTSNFMSLDPEPENILANMASLLILNEFDNIIGYIFEIKVNEKFPKLQMVDDLLKDEFKIKSQKIATTFTRIFLYANSLFIFASWVYSKDTCQHFDQFWIDKYQN